jgi:hypothetical protein
MANRKGNEWSGKMAKQKRAIGLLCAAVCMMISLGLTVPSVSALSANVGFETGDFTGWTVDTGIDGVAEVITSHTTGLATTYLPVEGTYFARLEPSFSAGVPTTLNQSLDLAAGETICGYAAFDAQELPEDPDNDSAWVRILDSALNEIAMPWYSDVSMIGASGDGPWTYWEWTAPANGTYYVQYGVTNYFWDGLNSVALFDGCLPPVFDTGEGTYPSMSGTFTGTIVPSRDLTVNTLYTYNCEGTGGHTTSIELYENTTQITSGLWRGYQGDWHTITLSPEVTLVKDHEYRYVIVTGSYPQIIHASNKDVTGGTITCTGFEDANGVIHEDWIPAIKLY